MNSVNYGKKAENLLIDINVYLYIQSALESERLIFEDFSPHFASMRGFSLSSALVAAYERLDTPQQFIIRGVVDEAFDRCANQELGAIRTMVVLELAYAMNREKFSTRLWWRLSERFYGGGEDARWRGDLILFFIENKITVNFTNKQIRNFIELVEVDKLKSTVYYFADFCGGDGLNLEIKNAALDRLHDDVKMINEEDIDFDDLRSYILSIDEECSDENLVKSNEQQDRENLDHELKSDWLGYKQDDFEEIWPSYLELNNEEYFIEC
jgi:hypothetical protein